MIKNNFIKILISIITIFLFLMIFYHVINQLINREEIIRPVDQEKFQGKATLIINNGIQSKIFTVNFKEEITAFDLLKDKAGELNMNLKTKTYDIGIFIEAIGDKENGQCRTG